MNKKTEALPRERYRSFLEDQDQRTGSFLEIGVPEVWDCASGATGSDLTDFPLAVKDNIAVEGYHLTCGSSMLQSLNAPYTATAVERLVRAGALVVGKTNMDEFGMGSSTANTPLGTTVNPWDHSRVAGGSSGGSAAAVAQQLVPVALGSDTGGSVRQPAAFCGVYGLKPTYGAVSRFGLTAYASSLETIGVLGARIEDVTAVFRAIRGEDPRDQTSRAWPHQENSKAGPTGAGGSSGAIGVLQGDLGLSPEVERNYQATKQALTDLGYRLEPVRLSTLDYVVPAYYTIATAEASANLARYNGIRYGHQPAFAENPEELMRKARSQALGDEVKLRILLGTFVLRSGFQDQFYLRAQKIRTLIRQELDRVYQGVQALLMPVFPRQAFLRDPADGMDSFQQKVADRFTCTANLAGLPSLAVPTGLEEGLPVGMQLMGPAFSEEDLCGVAQELSAVFPPEFPDSSCSFAEWHQGRDSAQGGS
ncbi:aspartyl/glutamyl-tRNA(Asn/Gln) amidotransferase subunit A [Alkalispirochaeta americana]|uniref:Glutamyl-tRNA(Gln) amidotransferase subunit A n=1 Tax=Alkalispirochaeta americana TaxID=159291 RepID=A0A1N6QAV8_9SPIO|nr:amidase family protein [Alkalispirochaeta americana]SIQ13685.1 aspartyl/glutamyl-tRNA(Asn/Gln) amidotransferase subunit A [Alkalispirochaeta americana]